MRWATQYDAARAQLQTKCKLGTSQDCRTQGDQLQLRELALHLSLASAGLCSTPLLLCFNHTFIHRRDIVRTSASCATCERQHSTNTAAAAPATRKQRTPLGMPQMPSMIHRRLMLFHYLTYFCAKTFRSAAPLLSNRRWRRPMQSSGSEFWSAVPRLLPFAAIPSNGRCLIDQPADCPLRSARPSCPLTHT